MGWLLLGTFLASFALTAALVPLARGWARRAGMIDVPGGRKAHAGPTPLGGGIAIVGAAVATLGAGAAVAWAASAGVFTFPLTGDAARHLPGAVSQIPRLLLVLGGGLAVAGLGVVDDLRDLSPRAKLAGQCAVALGLALVGDIRLSVFSEGAGGMGRAVSVAATVAWIAAVTNAFNLLDHRDGICAGAAAACSAVFIAVALQTGQFFIAALLLVGAGGAGGFLLYNFPPAGVFLGDAGSQFLGYWLAVATVLFTFYEPPYALFSYFVPLVVLAIPLYDLVRVVGIRLAERRSVFRGDRNHLGHRLEALGCTSRQAALAVILLTAVTAAPAVLLHRASAAGAGLVFANVVALLVLIGLAERVTRRRRKAPEAPGRNGS